MKYLLTMFLISYYFFGQNYVSKGIIKYDMVLINEKGINKYEAKLLLNENLSCFTFKAIGTDKETSESTSENNLNINITKIDSTKAYIFKGSDLSKIFNVLSNNFEKSYFEPEITFNWLLTDKTKTINNFDCSMATTTFKGRNYEAYYTTDIPISSGPYKFSGLPGLILEISDTNNEVFFGATEITFPYITDFGPTFSLEKVTKTKDDYNKELLLEQIKKNLKIEETLKKLQSKAGRDTTFKVEITTAKTKSIELD